jgi:hypothetical protein
VRARTISGGDRRSGCALGRSAAAIRGTSRWSRSNLPEDVVRHLPSHRSRLAIATALGTLLVATIAAPSNAAGTWGDTKQVSNTANSTLADAELRSKYVVVAQAVSTDDKGSKLRLIRSGNSGKSFGSPINVRNNTRQQSVTVCGDGTPVAVYGRNNGSQWTIEQSIRTGGDSWSRRTLTSPNEYPRHPESVCESDPSVVWSAWLTKNSSGTYQVKVARAAQTDSGLPQSIIVGSAGTTQTGPVLTALSGGAGVAVAWQAPNGNVATRNVLFSGSLAMTSLINLGLGAGGQPATTPQAGSFNQRIVIAWTQCADVYARVSTNNGTSWANAKKLANYACPGEIGGNPTSAAVRTNNIAIAYDLVKPSNPRERIVTSNDNLTNFKNNNVTSAKAAWLAGYVVVSGDIRLGVVFEQGSNIRFRRCSTPVCGSF